MKLLFTLVRSHRMALIFSLAILIFMFITESTFGAFNATLNNHSTSYGGGALILQDLLRTGELCSSSTNSIATNSTSCTGNAIQKNTLKNGSSLNIDNLSVNGSSCAMLVAPELINSNVAPLINNVSVSTASYFSDGSSFNFGGNGYLTTSQNTLPSYGTIAVWFETTSTNGGTLVSVSPNQFSSGTGATSLGVWMNNNGNVVFGEIGSNNKYYEAISSNTYNDGKWHFIAANYTSSGNPHLNLYIDNTLVATTNGDKNPNQITGWWHIGWGYESAGSGWSTNPGSNYFTGNITDASFFNTPLTTVQINTLFNTGTQAAYSTTLQTYSPTYYWPLLNTITTQSLLSGFTNTIPDISGNNNTGIINGILTTSPALSLSTNETNTLNVANNGLFFNGSSYLETTNKSTNVTGNILGPQTFSEVAWFNTTSTNYNTIISFSSGQTLSAAGSNFDRILWLDNTGKLHFGVYPGTNGPVSELSSTSSYNNGSWHLAVATLSSAGANLYVDGVLVDSNAAITSAQTDYQGWWYLGAGYWTNGWTSAPAAGSNYFNGSLSDMAIIPDALSAAQVSTLYTAGSQFNEQQYLAQDLVLPLTGTNNAVANFWPLTSSYYCQNISISIYDNTTGDCLFPAYAGNCPTLSSNNTLAFLDHGIINLGNLAVGTNTALTISISIQGTYINGVYISLPLEFLGITSNFTASLFYDSNGVTNLIKL